MPPTPDRLAIGLFYDDDAYTEPTGKRGAAIGLMGRHVAGREFLDALLRYGSFGTLAALASTAGSEVTLRKRWAAEPAERTAGKRLVTLRQSDFHAKFLSAPPAPVIHFPNPPDTRFAWVRQAHGRLSFALTGVTMTICSETIIRAISEYVTAPLEECDSIVCISRAVAATIQRVGAHYAEYLAERFGGRPALRMRVEWIPLGVNLERHRPATADERAAARTLIGATPDEVVVLCVGRISFHAKAHPFPMYAAVAEAARRTGKAVHLVLAGSPPNDAVDQAFREGASAFAPGVRFTVFDGRRPEFQQVWRAADVFTLLSDNFQESFGQAITEGMAAGLPVVTTDWDGCRDLVTDGESGFLIPTYLVADAAADATSKLLTGELSYDHFLAGCNQSTAVDVGRAAEAFTRLVGDPELRRQMGTAARKRAVEHFSWQRVIGQYEHLWALQAALLKERAEAARTLPTRPVRGPAVYPPVDYTFGAYPTRTLGDTDRVEAVPNPPAGLDDLLKQALTSYLMLPRVTDATGIRAVLAKVVRPTTLAEMDRHWATAGVNRWTGRNTVGWLLKYGLLRVV